MPQKEYFNYSIEDVGDLYSAVLDVLEESNISTEESRGNILISEKYNHRSISDFSVEQLKDLEGLPIGISYTFSDQDLQIVYNVLDGEDEFYLRKV